MASANDVVVKPKSRLIGLDLLRLLAILLVLGRHMEDRPDTFSYASKMFFETWKRGGWVGVDLFFVLSGFLVSGLLFSEYQARGRLSLARFYTRRGWKIYPPFYTLIVCTILVNYLFDLHLYRRQVFSELTFLQSYLLGMWNHTWSLSVEEHFYILLPLLLLLMLKADRNARLPFRSVLVVMVCLALGLLGLRIWNWQHGVRFTKNLFSTHLRLDSLFFGVTISYLFHFHTDEFVTWLRPWRRYLIVLGVLFLTPAFVLDLETTPFIYTVGLTIFYLGSGMLLVGILLSRVPESRLILWLAAIGAFSYSIYLWHMPTRDWVIPTVEYLLGRSLGFRVRAGFFLIGSIVLGIGMAKLIELPALRLRDRWFPSNVKAVGNPPPEPAPPCSRPSDTVAEDAQVTLGRSTC